MRSPLIDNYEGIARKYEDDALAILAHYDEEQADGTLVFLDVGAPEIQVALTKLCAAAMLRERIESLAAAANFGRNG